MSILPPETTMLDLARFYLSTGIHFRAHENRLVPDRRQLAQRSDTLIRRAVAAGRAAS